MPEAQAHRSKETEEERAARKEAERAARKEKGKEHKHGKDKSHKHERKEHKHGKEERGDKKKADAAKAKERKAREERERREKDKARAPGKAPAPRGAGGAGPPESRLRRQTNFLCHIQFRNELPPVPVDSKLLAVPVDLANVTRYSHASLLEERGSEMLVEPDLGIPLDVLSLDQYVVPVQRPQLAPEDAALLGEGPSGADAAGFRRGELKLAKGSNTDWLMRTQYMSDKELPKQGRLSEKQVRELSKRKEQQVEEAEEEDPRQAAMKHIEESFRASQLPPTHKTNKALTAVEVLPVLPDFERWPSPQANALVHFQFDSDPLTDIERFKSASESRKTLAHMHAAVKNMSSEVEDRDGKVKDEKFIALFVPTDEGLEHIEGGAGAGGEGEGDAVGMEWVREYGFTVRGSQLVDETDTQTYVMSFRDGRVSYLPFNLKVTLKKKALRKHIELPERVSKKRRAPTEGELAAAKRARLRLERPEEAAVLDEQDLAAAKQAEADEAMARVEAARAADEAADEAAASPAEDAGPAAPDARPADAGAGAGLESDSD